MKGGAAPAQGRAGAPGRRGGFVLAVVIFLLFAIGVAAATGYQVVSTAFVLSGDARQGQEALATARGGLRRFFAEQIGMVGDSVSYAVGSGVALVTSRKLYELDTLNHMYYVVSEGRILDMTAPENPARRIVGAYAWHRISPVSHRGTIMLLRGDLELRDDVQIDGLDRSGPSDCSGGGTAGVPGAATVATVTVDGNADLDGNPPSVTFYSSYGEMYDTIGLRWDVLRDPAFPVEFEGAMMPPWSSLPPDSFPIWRIDGDVTLTSGLSGRGALIVTGQLGLGDDFRWEGIILAGSIADVDEGTRPHIDGMLIGGLDGTQTRLRLRDGRFHYESCHVYSANRSLSHLERVPTALFEAR